MDSNLEVQTRSECGELQFFDSVAKAHKAYLDDSSIWKISWSVGNKHHRFRPLSISELLAWSNLSLQKIRSLLPQFDKLANSTILWVDQLVCGKLWCEEIGEISTKFTQMTISNQVTMKEADEWYREEMRKLQKKFPTEKDYEEWSDAQCIMEVLTDVMFRAKYCV